MKIRYGFVSNSSTTSFIIKYDKSILTTKCPTCGHKPFDLVDLVELLTQYNNYSGNKVEWTDPQEYIDKLQEQIRDDQEYLSELEYRKKSKDLLPSKLLSVEKSIQITKARIPILQKVVLQMQKLVREQIDNPELVVAEILVSYHDNILNNYIKELKDSGKIEVLDKQEG